MFSRLLHTVILLSFFMLGASAQSIRFTVLDKENRQPVSLAYVNIYTTANNSALQSLQTNEQGVAEIYPASYPCTIEINTQGYEAFRKEYLTAPVNANITILLSKKFSALNEVVVTGVSEPVKLKNALSAYQVIPGSLIRAQGAVTLGEALKNQLNISIGNDGVLGSNVRMQGMAGDKVKILVDGMPVNGREGGNINLSQINMNNVERIEVIQGPMSVIYGTDAIGGVINVITRKENKKIGARVNTLYETVGRYNADASFTYKLKQRHQITLGGGRNFFGGYQNIDKPLEYNGVTVQSDRAFFFKPNEQYVGNFAYNYVAPSQFKLGFVSDFLKEKVTNKGSLQAWDPWRAYAIDEYYHTTRSMNRLFAEGKIGNTGKWQSQNSYALYYRIRNRLEQDMVTLDKTPTTGKGDQDTTRFQNITLRSSYANHYNLLTYTIGYDINFEFARSLKVNGYEKQIQDYGIYTNLSYVLLKDKLTAQGGLRGSYNTAFNAPVVPSFHLLYTPRKDVQIRSSYSKGFRAPSLKEMYLSFIDQNHYIVGNRDIRAENSNHIQLSASYQAYEKQADYLQFSVTGYYNEVKDGIALVPLKPEDSTSIEYMYNNVRHQSNLIGSAQIDGQWHNFHAQLGFSYNYTFQEKGSYAAFNATEANAMLQYAWRKAGLNVNVFYKYTGTQPFLQNNIDGSATYAGSQAAFSTCDGSIEKKLFNNRLQIIAGVKNIFDLRRRQVSGILTSGTTHSGGGTGFFMPRSFYTSLHFTID